ncbi:syntaxin-8 [Drosophila bipectinata]|uniref:syntaxin-8 n=1 Tax=Drosophila bipectinata TaxID=42026 RepID=UPI001C8A9B17|nr:syntaxin-8 [Drosophila bipectinata]
MALVDHDSWDIEYEGCERLRHQLLVHLNQRQQLNPNDAKYLQLTASVKSGLEQLGKDVKHLKVVLDNAVTWETSPAEEIEQRRIDFDRLTFQLREINEKFVKSSRSNVLAASPGVSSPSVWQNQDQGNRPTDVDTLKLRQAEMLENQNRGLDALSATLSRQRILATQLGNEVEDQNNILDNLADAMDRVENGVQRETQSIGQVYRRDSTWRYWLVIIALFVAIIVVIFV